MTSRIERSDMVAGPRRPVPDPARHADALINAFGFEAALQIVTTYARNCPSGTYWPRVLRALSERRLLVDCLSDFDRPRSAGNQVKIPV